MSRLRPVMSRGLPLSVAFLFLGLAACLEKVPPAPAVSQSGPAPTAGVVTVQMDPEALAKAMAEKGPSGAEIGVLRVLHAANQRAASCYTAALAKDPYLYGEVLIRLTLDGQGGVVEAATRMDTVGDQELVSCVERLVQAQRYPAPGGEGLSLRYPFLFSSDLTPPEVVRAMKAGHGLLEEEPSGLDLDSLDGGPTGHGTVETW